MNAVPMNADYTPRYIRIAKLLQGRIEDGTYPLGSLLPQCRLACWRVDRGFGVPAAEVSGSVHDRWS